MLAIGVSDQMQRSSRSFTLDLSTITTSWAACQIHRDGTAAEASPRRTRNLDRTC